MRTVENNVPAGEVSCCFLSWYSSWLDIAGIPSSILKHAWFCLSFVKTLCGMSSALPLQSLFHFGFKESLFAKFQLLTFQRTTYKPFQHRSYYVVKNFIFFFCKEWDGVNIICFRLWLLMLVCWRSWASLATLLCLLPPMMPFLTWTKK